MRWITYREPHSVDGETFILRDDSHRWAVWVRGVWIASWFRREDARVDIRERKL